MSKSKVTPNRPKFPVHPDLQAPSTAATPATPPVPKVPGHYPLTPVQRQVASMANEAFNKAQQDAQDHLAAAAQLLSQRMLTVRLELGIPAEVFCVIAQNEQGELELVEMERP